MTDLWSAHEFLHHDVPGLRSFDLVHVLLVLQRFSVFTGHLRSSHTERTRTASCHVKNNKAFNGFRHLTQLSNRMLLVKQSVNKIKTHNVPEIVLYRVSALSSLGLDLSRETAYQQQFDVRTICILLSMNQTQITRVLVTVACNAFQEGFRHEGHKTTTYLLHNYFIYLFYIPLNINTALTWISRCRDYW